ncbi:hypothetical protein BDY19DRAFT_915766 [Irpex rosettiformis]|uniref:Uncharacterized protein n=1 Tax=Irpex rosettiformis TaxID=378272 RepID=A0ACB8UKM2_9APHY|nr:hypothetical protein BDY19DRAFT_915766 [Irpex rosettiformis]
MAEDSVVDKPNAMLDFPSTGAQSQADLPHPLPQHLPFRRISFPTSARSVPLRPTSVVSTASFDSTDNTSLPPSSFSSPAKTAPKAQRHRLTSGDVNRRQSKRREVKSVVANEQRYLKRRKIIHEFCETERTYVEGLELIYSHFLTPIIASLDTPNQLLDRNELTSVFHNFIDIWNLHRSFYSSLSTFMNTLSPVTYGDNSRFSSILLSHFPYLSLYTPFVTSFSEALASYHTLLSKHAGFAKFIATQEADPRCGKLKFRDWMLTLVQRCPRYLLLLKDIINHTDPEDSEYQPLLTAHSLISKITDSLNASLQVHSQTLELVAIQRSTAHLPFQLIEPGRTFIKRGPLIQVLGSVPKEREFLLFSDCIIWLSSVDKDSSEIASKWEAISSASRLQESGAPPHTLMRTRSKSDPELPRLIDLKKRESGLKLKLTHQRKNIKRMSSGGGDERWTYKGHIDLVDLEVVVGSSGDVSEERRLELLSPQLSFALYADSLEERDEWSQAIRNAKSSLLLSLHMMHPNSTLTASASTNHLRRALQALPYSPDEDGNPQRGRVEHFVPAVWVPDGKTEGCMRCGRTFGWKRRRHHCRLCGRCICAQCSTKTFFIIDSSRTNPKDSHKSARACDACYDTVFPLIDPLPAPPATHETLSRLTLSGLRSMPSLLLDDHQLHVSPSVLMAVDFESSSHPAQSESAPMLSAPRVPSGDLSNLQVSAVRFKSPSRPRSYIHILEDFSDGGSPEGITSGSLVQPRLGDPTGHSSYVLDELAESEDDTSQAESGPVSAPPDVTITPLPRLRRNEDTVRKRKRFSLPALAIHTTPVTARPNAVGDGKSKRWSLVLGNWRSGGPPQDGLDSPKHGVVVGKLSEMLRRHNQAHS